MGLISRLLSFVRTQRNNAQISDVKLDPGGGANITAEHFAPPGDDSHPLPNDYVYSASTPQRGRFAAIGYIDTLNAPKAAAGEKRIYARNSSGAPVVEVWLKNDGTATVVNSAGQVTLSPAGSILGSNGAGSFELQAGGDFVVNGVTIAASGAVTIPTSLTLSGLELAGHTHAQANDSGGNTEQDTGPNQ